MVGQPAFSDFEDSYLSHLEDIFGVKVRHLNHSVRRKEHAEILMEFSTNGKMSEFRLRVFTCRSRYSQGADKSVFRRAFCLKWNVYQLILLHSVR